MDADHPVDDEFKPRKADTADGNIGEIERSVRVAHVHHDLHRNLGQLVQLTSWASKSS